ncbi:hypothetical protein ACFX16_006915 [Malus domestica]
MLNDKRLELLVAPSQLALLSTTTAKSILHHCPPLKPLCLPSDLLHAPQPPPKLVSALLPAPSLTPYPPLLKHRCHIIDAFNFSAILRASSQWCHYRCQLQSLIFLLYLSSLDML